MTYRGLVKNGQIILDQGIALGEGAVVEVTEISPRPSAPRGSARAILASKAQWHGPQDEPDRLLAELKREKWAEVEAEGRANGDTAGHGE
jgi:hypothetical protein